ncbi:MAG TPA: hypothetical protein VLM85_11530 [Polyangiaceae bacterium]|nr:hypothetical protein [Polyangiaceae bacterium]
MTALFACQFESSFAPAIGDSDASVPRNAPSGSLCPGAAGSGFALPLAGNVTRPFEQSMGSVPCAAGKGSYDFALIDMDGDLREDLVVTRSCDDPSVGLTTSWLVYRSSSAGFGAPVRYVLPVLSTVPGCIEEKLVDVDGDRRPDLLITSSCVDLSIGTSAWLLYANTGTAFELAPRSFALPPAGAPGTFAPRVFSSLEQDTAQCDPFRSSRPAYAFFDLTGDLKPDFVFTSACDDPNVGVSHWRVYPSTGAGVGPPIDFALPPGSTFAFPRGGDWACRPALSSPRYYVVDFDGDLKPDLVVTKSCSDVVNVGTNDWLVYTNTGTSFVASPRVVPLPLRGLTTTAPFDRLDQTVECASGAKLSHTLVDVDGDFKPDLVLTRDCLDHQVGALGWLVFLNDGSALSGPSTYTLPDVLGATMSAPAALEGEPLCDTSRPRAAFRAEHFFGPELDLLVTATCNDPTVGRTRWLAYRPSCLVPPR